MPPHTKYELKYYKAQAMKGSYYHFLHLLNGIGSYDTEDHVHILNIGFHWLHQTPPTMQALRSCLSTKDRPAQLCVLARTSCLAVQDFIERCPDWHLNPRFDSLIRTIWPCMWTWLDLVFLCHQPSLPSLIADYIYTPQIEALRCSALMLISRLISTNPHASNSYCHLVGDTPGFLTCMARCWFISAQYPRDEINISYRTNVLMSRMTEKAKSGCMDAILQGVGSPADFVACALGHICRLIGIDDQYAGGIRHGVMTLRSHLTAEIHKELLNQDSVRVVIDAMNYLALTSRQERSIEFEITRGIHNCTVYLSGVFNSDLSVEQIHRTFECHLPLVSMRATLRHVDLPLVPDIIRFQTRHLVYRRNLRTAGSSMRIITKEGLEDHPLTEDAAHAWLNFDFLLDELRPLKKSPLHLCTGCGASAERSQFRQCSVCGLYYCSQACQRDDWKHGYHRDVRILPDSLTGKEHRFLMSITCSIWQKYEKEISSLYQGYTLANPASSFPPLIVIISCATWPITITAARPEDYVSPSTSQYPIPSTILAHNNERPIVVFTELHVGTQTKHSFVSSATKSQPAPASVYHTRGQFLRQRNVKPEDAEAAIAVAEEDIRKMLESVER